MPYIANISQIIITMTDTLIIEPTDWNSAATIILS